jgi:hypothetical protein
MFPIFETSEPEERVASPNSTNSLASPTIPFHNPAVVEAEVEEAAAVAVAEVVVATEEEEDLVFTASIRTSPFTEDVVVAGTDVDVAVVVAAVAVVRPAAHAEVQSIPIASQLSAVQSTSFFS